MKTPNIWIMGILMILCAGCGSSPSDLPASTQSNTPIPEAIETATLSSFSDENIIFNIPPGWSTMSAEGEYFDLGLEELFAIQDATSTQQFFSIAASKLAEGETISSKFNQAYTKGPALEELVVVPKDRGEFTGIELTYQRPWGEPRWRFHDLWVELNGSVYVFSYRVYNTTYNPQSTIFDDLMDGFTHQNAIVQVEPTDPNVPIQPPKPPDTARIVFSATGWTVPKSGEEIFIMNVDGSGITPISNSAGDERDPCWSPDGKRIVFTSERDGNSEIYLMNADGTEQIRLTDTPENEHHPDWSPDGKRIVFSRTMPDKASDLFIIDLAGEEITRLTDTFKRTENYPDWSPDGSQIVYSAFGGEEGGIFAMKSDGSDPHLIMAGPLHYPKWSPDGKWIAFDGEPGGNNFEVYIMKANGTEMRQVTNHPGGSGEYNKCPSWSPDGKRLVYFSTNRSPTPGTDIFIINIDGSGETQLTFGKNDLHHGGFYPNWSPLP